MLHLKCTIRLSVKLFPKDCSPHIYVFTHFQYCYFRTFLGIGKLNGLEAKVDGPSQSIFCNVAEVAITHKVINANLATNRN